MDRMLDQGELSAACTCGHIEKTSFMRMRRYAGSITSIYTHEVKKLSV